MNIKQANDIDTNEIDKLETFLLNFQEEWEEKQAIRSAKWRKYFLISFMVVIVISSIESSFAWMGLAVIAYFAGSLYSQLRLNAKTSNQIVEHKKQLQLVRLLRNFESSPYSQE